MDNFVDISSDTLLSLLQKDNLNCTELQLFQACIRWSKFEINEQPNSNLRQILNPYIPHIRLLTIPGSDFATEVKSTNIFTHDEVRTLALNLLAPNTEPLPSFISSTTTKRTIPNDMDFYVFGQPIFQRTNCSVSTLRVTPNFNSTSGVFVHTERTILSRTAAHTIQNFTIPSQIKDLTGGSSDTTYKENLTAYVIIAKTNVILYSSDFTSNSTYNSNISIPLNYTFRPTISPCELIFKVIYHNTGMYRQGLTVNFK